MQMIIGCVASYDEKRLFLEKVPEAIEAMKASLVYLPHSRNAEVIKTYYGIMDGLILSGGIEDIMPKWYREEPCHKLGPVDELRDYFEFALLEAAFDTDLPVLGICRGLQIINVAAGGTLHQDLPFQRQGTIIDHTGDWDKYESGLCGPNVHLVQIAAGTILGTLMTDPNLEVNSYHHQAVKDLAPGFRISALAEDGVIEAIESERHSFIVGVQWHAELLWNWQQAIFREFVARAKERRRRRTTIQFSM